MKKLLVLILTGIFLFITASCGSKEPAALQTAPTTWVGQWKGVNGDGEQKFIVDISSDKIEINWKLENGDTALYWAGTFEDLNKGSILSQADEEALAHSVLGSQSPTKEFINQEGSLYFEVRAMGVTKQIHLEK